MCNSSSHIVTIGNAHIQPRLFLAHRDAHIAHCHKPDNHNENERGHNTKKPHQIAILGLAARDIHVHAPKSGYNVERHKNTVSDVCENTWHHQTSRIVLLNTTRPYDASAVSFVIPSLVRLEACVISIVMFAR